MKIDTKKIGLFLKSIDGVDYLYMQHCMEMRSSIENLIKRHNITKQDICEKFRIKPAKYNDFVKGNYNYSTMDIAVLNSLFVELETEKLKESSIFQETTSK